MADTGQLRELEDAFASPRTNAEVADSELRDILDDPKIGGLSRVVEELRNPSTPVEEAEAFTMALLEFAYASGYQARDEAAQREKKDEGQDKDEAAQRELSTSGQPRTEGNSE